MQPRCVATFPCDSALGLVLVISPLTSQLLELRWDISKQRAEVKNVEHSAF